MEHEIKIWPDFYQAIIDNLKGFELRKNDRDYKAGDTVMWMEFDPNTKRMTGRHFSAEISYVCKKFDGLQEGYCIFSWL